MKLRYYVMVEVIIKRWTSKSTASSDLSTKKTDSNFNTIPKTHDKNVMWPLNSSEVRPLCRQLSLAIHYNQCRPVYLSVLFASQEQVLGLYPRHPTVFCHNDAIESLTETESEDSHDCFEPSSGCMYLTMKSACSKCLAFYMKQKHSMQRQSLGPFWNWWIKFIFFPNLHSHKRASFLAVNTRQITFLHLRSCTSSIWETASRDNLTIAVQELN